MISVASSIRFIKSDGLMASFGNTLHADRTYIKTVIHQYYHKLYSTDIITIQAEVDTGDEIAIQYAIGTLKHGEVVWGEWTDLTGEALVFSGTYYDYWEVDIDFSTFAATYVKFKVVMTSSRALPPETWYSEPVEIIATDDRYLQIEFFNLENAWHVYYVNPTEADRISHLLRIKGELKRYKPGGETSVFDNQNEVVKTSGEVKRTLTLETEAIPPYLAEMLAVALAHDKFFINEVEYVAEGNPEYENSGDLASFSVSLTQRDIPGFNAHDTGYNCDTISNSDTMVLQEEAASGQKTFIVPEGYLIGYITAYRTAGSPAIIAGTTPGGSEIVSGMALTPSYTYETANVGYPLSITGANNLYVTISGVGATATIIVLLFKNRQA